MSSLKIVVHTMSSSMMSDDVLMLGESQIRQLKIPAQQQLALKFGSFRHSVSVLSAPRYEGMQISQTLARRIGLFSGIPLHLKYESATRTLSLGPVIGVLLGKDNSLQPERPFGEITTFCRELTDACRKQGAFIYFFTPNSIKSNLASVEGWIYTTGWRKQVLPAPDVLNNRLTSRKKENFPAVQQFMQDIKRRYGAQVFNERFLEKSEVFEALKKDVPVRKYLPESHALKNFPMLQKMCSKYNTVYLKPGRGSFGRGIIRLSRIGPEGWQASYATVNGTTKQSFKSLPKMFSTISGKVRSVRYLIQQGLTLIETGGRPIDFRALTQKNGSGVWAVTSIVSRTAGPRHFVSNLARGGTLSTVKDTVAKSNLPLSYRRNAYASLQKAALDIARGVDSQIPAHFGELGIDLALDTSGRVWLLEVNSKPSKHDNTLLTEGKIRPSVRIMIQYARFISGF